MGTSYGGAIFQYHLSFREKDLKKVLNHVFNHLIVCWEDFDKSTEFHKKKIIKDLNYINKFSFKNFGVCIVLECDGSSMDIYIIELIPFLFLTKKEKIDFNNFLKYFKKFDGTLLQETNSEWSAEPIFEYKNHDFLLNLDEKAISKNGYYNYDAVKKGIKIYGDDKFFETTLDFKCDEKELENVIQNFFKDFKILSACNSGSNEKTKIPKSFLKSSKKINFKFNKLPIYVEFYKDYKDYKVGKPKNLETYFQIEFGFLFERDIREANENRKKLFNKHFKELKKLSKNIWFNQKWSLEDYFINTLFDENGFKLKKK